MSIFNRLDRRSAFLYQLFTTYSTSRYLQRSNEWVKDVMGTKEVMKMMTEIATDSTRPRDEEVVAIVRSIDKSGNLLLKRQEFMDFMLRGLTKSVDDMQRFKQISKANKRIVMFFIEVEAQVMSIDKSMTLDDVNMEIVMQEIQNVLLFNRTINEHDMAGAILCADVEKETKEVNPKNEDTRDHGDSTQVNSEDVIRIFKPKILEKAAEHIKDDELTRSALLNIVSEELRTNGLTNTPEQSAALQELLLASETGTGSRRVRLSGSKRNLKRVKDQFQEEQNKMESEFELIRTKQQAQTRKKLERRRSMRLESAGSKIMPTPANSFEMHTFLVSPEKRRRKRKNTSKPLSKVSVLPLQENPNMPNDLSGTLVGTEQDFTMF